MRSEVLTAVNVNVCLLSCNAMWTSTMKMEAVHTSGTLVSTYNSTWH
jgi:hypothetical protein